MGLAPLGSGYLKKPVLVIVLVAALACSQLYALSFSNCSGYLTYWEGGSLSSRHSDKVAIAVQATLNNLPHQFKMQVDLGADDPQAAKQESNVRWLIEQFYREAKQLTGLQACQCRLARSQRNHTHCKRKGWWYSAFLWTTPQLPASLAAIQDVKEVIFITFALFFKVLYNSFAARS
jgi:hypothetical protein